jgi:hypothetical protein
MTFENQLTFKSLWIFDITYMEMIGGVYLCDNYMLLVLWMLSAIVYMLCGGELLLIAYIQVLVMVR